MNAGEVLHASEIYTETVAKQSPTCCFKWLLGKTFRERNQEVNYLQCTDAGGREVNFLCVIVCLEILYFLENKLIPNNRGPSKIGAYPESIWGDAA